ncbi:MAG TPA: AMP-binding protein, partial [Myxococcota bacterium]|nr:AMP-binding protein [Myxococcota bacterium]
RLGHATDDRWLCCLPLIHVGGLSIFFRAAWAGARVRLHGRFDAARVAACLDAGEVSLVSLVPSMLEQVLAARDAQPFPPRLRAILLGGAPPTASLLERCRAMGVPLAVTWGMTETASQVATAFPGEIGPLGDCGAPLPFARIEARGEVLTVRGPVVAAPLITGDRGQCDAGGHVHVYGRRDDVILSGGENIAPEEVEAALRGHPGVADCAVVGVADARWGERAVAVVVRRPGELAPEAGVLEAFCRERLAAYKVPRQFVWARALPRDPLGKLRRRALRPLLGGEGPELEASEGVGEGGGDGARGPTIEVDADVHQADSGPRLSIGPGHGVGEGDGLRADGLDVEADVEALSEADGAGEVGLGVHQGHRPEARGEAVLEVPEHSGQQLLEGGVAVLEVAPEEDDPRPIDLAEPGRDAVMERHDEGR